MSAYSVNSVNKNFLTLRPFIPMPIVGSDISRMRLCVLVRVHLTCIADPRILSWGTETETDSE